MLIRQSIVNNSINGCSKTSILCDDPNIKHGTRTLSLPLWLNKKHDGHVIEVFKSAQMLNA